MLSLLWDNFVDKIKWQIEYALSADDVKKINISYNYNTSETEPVLEICIDSMSTRETIDSLNNNEFLVLCTSQQLERIFRYKGKFVFCEELPF